MEVKVVNQTNVGKKSKRNLFHYAHFICDCLFPEIVNDIHKYKKVIREREVYQSIGNFVEIYKKVMRCNHFEIDTAKFNALKIKTIAYKKKEDYSNKLCFDKFRNYIFNRFSINPSIYYENYPEVILIKRHCRIKLLEDPKLLKQTKNISTGAERKEIPGIKDIETYLQNKFGNKFQSIYLEFIPFKKQVKYFNNAKLIVCAHGAALSNMFFCKEGTKIIEVTRGRNWGFFNTISSILNLQHIKCNKSNKPEYVIDFIEENTNVQENTTTEIKVVNKRADGSLFHYAHFICDCLFPEIVNDIHKYKKVFRKKHIKQTLGNFTKIYENVMLIKNSELEMETFKELKIKSLIYKNREYYSNKLCFDKFRNYIFDRFSINSSIYYENYPEVILIKRYKRIQLINDPELKKKNHNVKTGAERREIPGIETIETYLQDKFKDKFKSIYLEFVPFEEQVKYFNNAKLIVCAHGACMANMFFCKEGTKIIEVVCNKRFPFFDVMSKILNLHHIKCNEIDPEKVLSFVEENTNVEEITV
jgi:hypothetical protein